MSKQTETKSDTGCSLERMVSLLERSKCYCHELRNNYVLKHGPGDHTTDILEHIKALHAEIERLKQANSD